MRKSTKGILAVIGSLAIAYLAGGRGPQPEFIRESRLVPSEIKATYTVGSKARNYRELEQDVGLHRREDDITRAHSEFNSDSTLGFEGNPLWVIDYHQMGYFEVHRLSRSGTESITIDIPY